MANYRVRLGKPPKGHVVPELLVEVGAWIGTQPHGSLGWFDALVAESIPKEWSERHATRLRKAGFAFLQLPDGSLLALLDVDGAKPVVLLDSEGEARTVAESLEELLVLWAKAETGIDELDDDEASARPALAKWLRAHKIKAPKPKRRFDFQAWLEGNAPPPTPAPKTTSSPALAKLGPKLREVATLVGRRADDAEVVRYVGKVLKKKSVATTTEAKSGAWVEGSKQGINLLFSHQILHDAFAPQAQSANSFVPYLSRIDLSEAFAEPILGVAWTDGAKEIEKKLGPPSEKRSLFKDEDKLDIPYWIVALDPHVVLEIHHRKHLRVSVLVGASSMLAQHDRKSMGLFVAWAIERGLLDRARFPEHAALYASVAKRKSSGLDFVDAALPRGLWENHLVDRPGLRTMAYRWFHNMKNLWIRKDLIGVFGARKGPHGHQEPAFDEPTWAAVDAATPALEARFAKWVK